MVPRASLVPLLALAVLAACRASAPPPPPPPLAHPDWSVELRRHQGSPLSGPKLQSEDWNPNADRHVRLRWILLRPPAPRRWSPLPARARVIAEHQGNSPWRTGSQRSATFVVASGDQARGFLEGLGQDPERSLVLEDLTLEIVPATTLLLEGSRTEVVAAPGDFLNELAVRGPLERRFSAQLHQPAPDAPVEIALSWTDTDSLRSIRRTETMGALVPVDPTELREELFVLKDVLAGPEDLVVVVGPVPFQEPAGTLLAVVAEPVPTTAPTEQRLQELGDEFQVAHTRLQEDLAPSGIQEATNLRRSSAWAALRSNAERRSALVFLGSDLHVPLTTDVALSTSDAFLATLAQRLLEQAGPGPDLDWTLERQSWALLAETLISKEDDLQAQGMALRHAGQVARFPDVLRGILAVSTGLEDFQDRLRQENRSFLEDADPAARVRAHDWLRRRGAAVPGYDPLADAAQRRAALEGGS